jgi:hypothetical protein
VIRVFRVVSFGPIHDYTPLSLHRAPCRLLPRDAWRIFLFHFQKFAFRCCFCKPHFTYDLYAGFSRCSAVARLKNFGVLTGKYFDPFLVFQSGGQALPDGGTLYFAYGRNGQRLLLSLFRKEGSLSTIDYCAPPDTLVASRIRNNASQGQLGSERVLESCSGPRTGTHFLGA